MQTEEERRMMVKCERLYWQIKSTHQVITGLLSFSHYCLPYNRLLARPSFLTTLLSMGFPGGSDHKDSAYHAGDPGSIPGLGRFPGKGNGHLLGYSCLENSMDRGAWRASAYGITQSDTTDRLTLLSIPSPLFSIPWYELLNNQEFLPWCYK